jgi:cupin fold WbuC family metalloprotein
MKLDANLFEPLLAEAKLSPRKRAHRNLHADFNEPVQRTCIALAAGTYVRPHFHPQTAKWELLVVLHGTLGVLLFDETGTVRERLELSPGGAVEINSGTWHTVFPLGGAAVMLDIKEGPYDPSAPVFFAEWTPAEGDAAVADFLQWAATADAGAAFHGFDSP